MTKRLLSAVVLGTILLTPALASAATKSVSFEFGVDRSAWFWKNQQEATAGEDPPLPGGVVHQQRAPNPQADDTLPVAVQNGDLEKASILLFDLASRGVTAGSTISKMVVTLQEGSTGNEQPSYNAGGKKIQACAVGEFWPAGQAELWSQRPDYDDKACAAGKRAEKGGTATWTFNLTSLAAAWGEDPSAYNGLALVPASAEGGPSGTWQLNLKIPNRDEYKQTKNRARMELVFDPGAVSGTATSQPFTAPAADFSSSFPSSTDTSGFASSGTATETAPATATGAAPVANTAAPAPVPQMPGYVWLLVPLGLLALSAVRSVILEPVGGPRPDGVIAAIRTRNAERRGVTLQDRTVDPLTRAATAMRGGVRRVAGAPKKAWNALKITRRKS